MTQVARGLDPDGLLLLDVMVNGVVPESLADADLQVQVGGEAWMCRQGGRENGCPAPSHPLAARPTVLPDTHAGAWGWPGLDLGEDWQPSKRML